jgi:polyisoprenyl-phosphate glycosyltransferase
MNLSIEAPILSIVIPVFSEEHNLRSVFDALAEHVSPLGLAYEVILIDDGSSDQTWSLIMQEAQANPLIRGKRFTRNFGKEAALYAGIEMARGQAVIVMDGDLQHPPSLIPHMVRLWQDTGVEVVEAKKVDRGRESLLQKLAANLFYRGLQLLSGYDLSGLSDFKLLDRKVVDAWLALDERNRFFRGMVAWLGFRHVQVTFVTPRRQGGKSSWSVLRLIALALEAVTSFSSKPLQFVTLMGAVFSLGALILTARVLYQIIVGTAVSGFATVILLLLIIGSSTLFGLGLIGMYLAKIYAEIKRRPLYVESETTTPLSDEINLPEAVDLTGKRR